MTNIIDTEINACGVPVHNPPYKSKNLWCRFNLVKLDLTVQKPWIIADIIPKPLEWIGNNVYISANKVQDYKGFFAAYVEDEEWNEILIQVPVQYKKTFYYYNCEIFTTHFGIVSGDREMYGFPKIPADIHIQRDTEQFKAKAYHYGGRKEICNIEFKPKREGTIADLGIRPKIINMRNIPSPFNGYGASIKQLVALKYKKQKVHRMVVGDAKIELLDWFPAYIKEAGVKNITKAVYIDVELEIECGRLVYDYNANYMNE